MSKKNLAIISIACAVLIVGISAGAWWFISKSPMSESDFDESATEILRPMDRAISEIGGLTVAGANTQDMQGSLTAAIESLADAVDEGADAAEKLRAPDSRNDSAEDLETALDGYEDVADELLDLCDAAKDEISLFESVTSYLDENAARLKKTDRMLMNVAGDVDYEPKSEGLFAALSSLSTNGPLTAEQMASGSLPQGHPSIGGGESGSASALTEDQLASGSLPPGHASIGGQSGSQSGSDPEGVIRKFLAAQASGDWQTAWDILPGSTRSRYGTLDAYTAQLKSYGDLSDYGIASSVTNDSNATVVSWTSVQGMKFGYEWQLRRDGSVWKVTDRTQASVE